MSRRVPPRSAFGRVTHVLRNPSKWNWKVLGAGGAAVTAGALALWQCESQRSASLREQRVFNLGSPLQSIEGSLRTGDLLLFNRNLFDPTVASLNPLRFAIVLLQKLQGRSDYDHVAVVVCRNEYPYVLERGPSGNITMRSFESRMLHSSSEEIIIRRLQAPAMTDSDQNRMEEWVRSLMGEPSASNIATTTSPAVTPAAPTARYARNEVSNVHQLSPFTLLGHLLLSSFLTSSSTTSTSSSTAISSLGHLFELSSELAALDARIEEMQNKLDPAQRTNVVSSSSGSTTSLQRLLVRRKDLAARFERLQDQVELSDQKWINANNDIDRVCDFPSASLVVRTLQILGVMPDAASQKQLRLHSHGTLDSKFVAPISTYAPRQFLSSASVPITYLPPSLPQSGSVNRNADPAASVECYLDREMFLKAKHRKLAYTVEGADDQPKP